MELIYEGVDITEQVDIVKAVHRDVSRGRCDCLELELDHAAAWYSWKPEAGDRIEFREGKFSTGELYLNTILPEEGKYRLLATSMTRYALGARSESYENLTLQEIMNICAAQSSMEARLYGLSGENRYPYLLRENCGAAAYLEALLAREGAVLKAINGRYVGIGIEYAQELEASQRLLIYSEQEDAVYTNRKFERYSRLTVRTPRCDATAQDADAPVGNERIITNLPARDSATAGRWARGLLLAHNRQAETLEVNMDYNDGLCAMARVDVDGDTDANGAWLVDEVEHDFVNLRSRVKLLRCIYGVK